MEQQAKTFGQFNASRRATGVQPLRLDRYRSAETTKSVEKKDGNAIMARPTFMIACMALAVPANGVAASSVSPMDNSYFLPISLKCDYPTRGTMLLVTTNIDGETHSISVSYGAGGKISAFTVTLTKLQKGRPDGKIVVDDPDHPKDDFTRKVVSIVHNSVDGVEENICRPKNREKMKKYQRFLHQNLGRLSRKMIEDEVPDPSVSR